MSKVYVGIGHGGTDPGAVANGYRESDLNLTIGKLIVEELNKNGIETKISRTEDITFSTASKIPDANTYNPDIVIDVHHNAGGGVGFEIYHSHNNDGSKEIAQNIYNQIEATGRKCRGVKTNVSNGQDYFGIIRQTKAPAVLIEYGFIDNVTDVVNITNPINQKSWAQCTAKGICKSLGVEYKTTSTLYRVQVGAFKNEKNARTFFESVKAQGYEAFIIYPTDDDIFRVQLGAFSSRDNAESYIKKVMEDGLEAFIVTYS